MRAPILLLGIVPSAIPAFAQSDPDLNESDMDATVPRGDEGYLDDGADGEGGAGGPEPTLSEGDFDTSVPPGDEAYLAEGASSVQTRRTPAGAIAIWSIAASALALLPRR